MKIFLAIIFALALAQVANAQVITVNINTASMTWDWTPTPTSDPIDGFRMHCGPSTNKYTNVVDIPDPTARSVLVKPVLKGTGTYFCVVTAYNKIGESGLSNEINFFAGSAPFGSMLLSPPK